MLSRLRASELLGKSQGDFLDRGPEMDPADVARQIQEALVEIDRRTGGADG